MKTYQTIQVKQCDEIQCDKCARVARRDGQDYEFQEFVSIIRSCGYGSCQSDGSIFEVDLCQYCSKELLSDFWREKKSEEKPTWDNFFNDASTPQSERDDLAIEIGKSRDSQLLIGTEPGPGQVYASTLGRHFLELSNESVRFLALDAGNNVDICVGDVQVTLWKKSKQHLN
jgi:hypothetical protein